jgi:hypothetical protein
MTTRAGFETFQLYLALQRHFTSNYDFHKYNGRVTASTDSYSKRPDLFAFEKLSKIIPEDERVDFLLSHFLDNPKEYIRNMSKSKHELYKSVLKNLSKTYETDLQSLNNEGMSECLKCVDNDIPLIHKKAISKSITIETVLILDSIFPFVDKHSETCKVPFVFPQHIEKLKKYRPFFNVKIEEKKELFREITKRVLL